MGGVGIVITACREVDGMMDRWGGGMMGGEGGCEMGDG